MIRVALAGIGNCASSLVQGRYYYSHGRGGGGDSIGLRYPCLGPYRVSDIEFVAAFDVDERKVGKDLSEGVFAPPNCATVFARVPQLNVVVRRGPVCDGVAEHMRAVISVDERRQAVDVAAELRRTRADMLICYLPVGSSEGARHYAEAALDAEVAFVNAIPEFICSDVTWIERFRKRGIPCVGDDIKSQVGATIVHRALSKLIIDRGQSVDWTYQLNVGGNTDFLNMTDAKRLSRKTISKTKAVTSVSPGLTDQNVHIGVASLVPSLGDRKVCYIHVAGRQFGGVPFELNVELRVEDSPNSAGVMVDVIRVVKIALDRGLSGDLEAIAAYGFKSPRIQYPDEIARQLVDEFVQNQ